MPGPPRSMAASGDPVELSGGFRLGPLWKHFSVDLDLARPEILAEIRHDVVGNDDDAPTLMRPGGPRVRRSWGRRTSAEVGWWLESRRSEAKKPTQ